MGGRILNGEEAAKLQHLTHWFAEDQGLDITDD